MDPPLEPKILIAHCLVCKSSCSHHILQYLMFLNLKFLYGINYMAKTGRDTWPWSNRKVGIYHKYDRVFQSSIWIVLQPTIIASRLPKLFADRAKSPLMEPHLVLFHSTAQSWTAYLKYIEIEVRKNVRPSCNVPKSIYYIWRTNSLELQRSHGCIHGKSWSSHECINRILQCPEPPIPMRSYLWCYICPSIQHWSASGSKSTTEKYSSVLVELWKSMAWLSAWWR